MPPFGRSSLVDAVPLAGCRERLVLSVEPLPVFGVAKRFGSARPRCREGARQVPLRKTFLQVTSPYEFMQKARVKAVAGSNGINHLDGHCRTDYLLVSPTRHRAFLSHLDDEERNP